MGTPLCVTIDHQSIEDKTVTIRYRDTMEQKRIPLAELPALIEEEVSMKKLFKILETEPQC